MSPYLGQTDILPNYTMRRTLGQHRVFLIYYTSQINHFLKERDNSRLH
jgi:hypothetical protein